jgi:hypothetical protein
MFLVTKGSIVNNSEAWARVASLVTRAEATLEAREVNEPDGRWALTAFSRYRVCQLLNIAPYEPYSGDLAPDPATLLEEAAAAVDQIEVSIDEVTSRLALADALRSAAVDVRMVQDARDL